MIGGTEIEPNLDVYFVNSSIMGAAAEENPSTTKERTFSAFDRSGAITQNRLYLESLFEQQMAAFINRPANVDNNNNAQTSSAPRQPPPVTKALQAPPVVSARGSQSSQGFSAGSQSFSGSQNTYGSQSISYGSQDFSASQSFSESQSMPGSQPSGSQPTGSQPSSQPTGSQPSARPRKKRALGF